MSNEDNGNRIDTELSPMQVAQVKANAQAYAEVLMSIVPQPFTSKAMRDKGTGGQVDEWKLSKIPRRALISLIYFQHRGEIDGVKFYSNFVDLLLRGSKSVDGLGLQLLKDITIGLAGGGQQKKLTKKPGWVGRNVTNRDWEKKAKRSNSQIVE